MMKGIKISITRGKVEVEYIDLDEYIEYLEELNNDGVLSANWRHYIYNNTLIETHYESALFNCEHELINYMNQN